ncbi:toll-like receptor 2 isoform X1 [Columba livia]|uniref:toll-like receptor 2 isoform X1 n=1 Tax=Columba livia TaxID=8932 RepID=UPI0031BBA399
MPGCPFQPRPRRWQHLPVSPVSPLDAMCPPGARGVWWLALLALLAPAGDAAQPLCQIDAAGGTGLCRGQGLARVPPALPGGLRELDLSYNKLREITAADFAGMTRLRRLDLAYNSISRIAPGAFLATPLLEHLRLFNNSLDRIPAPALAPLANLRWLDMSNNLYGSAALDGVFGRLRRLRELSLGGPLLRDVSRGDFAVLKDTALRKFAIKSASGLLRYEPGAFSWLNTTELWCDVALDGSAAALPAMLRDLRGKPLELLRFRNLFEFTYYSGDADPFAGLAELRVTKLVFYRGKFNENLLRLALLNIQRSRVRDLALVAIDFARSPRWDGAGAGTAAPRLNRLLLQDISNPDVLRFDGTFTWLSGVAALSIINVNFNYVPCDVWAEMRNVEALDISNNRLEDAFIYNQRCRYQGIMPKLESFTLATNQLLSLAVVAALTRSWPRLARLDASHNGLGGLRETCQWSPALRWLALRHNRVTVGTFGCLPTTLEFLDLSYSQLDRLDMDYFARSPRLRELRLSGNKIKFIPSEWTCPRLEVLAIDGNSFGVISRGSFVNMPRLVSLAAGSNPYHCTCDLHGFLEETRRRGRPVLADWPQNWTCYHPEALLDTAVAAYAPRPLECDVPALVAVAVAGTAVAVAACAVLCWKLEPRRRRLGAPGAAAAPGERRPAVPALHPRARLHAGALDHREHRGEHRAQRQGRLRAVAQLRGQRVVQLRAVLRAAARRGAGRRGRHPGAEGAGGRAGFAAALRAAPQDAGDQDVPGVAPRGLQAPLLLAAAPQPPGDTRGAGGWRGGGLGCGCHHVEVASCSGALQERGAGFGGSLWVGHLPCLSCPRSRGLGVLAEVTASSQAPPRDRR